MLKDEEIKGMYLRGIDAPPTDKDLVLLYIFSQELEDLSGNNYDPYPVNAHLLSEHLVKYGIPFFLVKSEAENVALTGIPLFSKHVEIFNNHAYLFVRAHLSWHQAYSFCKNLGGYLVVISSPEENEFVARLLRKYNEHSAWIGYYQDPDDLTDNGGVPEGCPGNEPRGCWKWVDEEHSTFTNWYPGEPNNAGGSACLL